MEITDEYIISYFYTKSKTRIVPERLLNISDDIKTYLDNRFNDSLSYIETVQRIKLGINEHPKCICGKPVKYIGSSKVFLQSCGCSECANKINQLHLKETSLKRYGVSNPAKSQQAKEKQKRTNIERYGCKCTLQNNNVKEKIKQTNIRKYGCEIAQQSDNVKNKIAKSNKETVKQKYGVDNISKLNTTTKKRKETVKQKYGVENIMHINFIKETNAIKIHETKTRNHTFNISKQEEIVYTNLVNIYGINDVKRQYKSDVYPFACDFYIPSLDLYIEYNGSWTHGGHPYDETNKEDLNTVQKWKDKHTKYYDNAINTWTIRDVNKRKITEKNNLNFIEFWNINEFHTYINNFQK